MPQEIADSDESDLDSPHRPSASPIPENSAVVPPNGTCDTDPFAHIAFDQFLSPTQRLSSAVERNDIPSSTERFLQDIAGTEQPSFNSASNAPTQDAATEPSSNSIPRKKSKRSLSDIETGTPRSFRDGESKQSSKKKAKTYGSSRLQKSNEHSIFTDLTDPPGAVGQFDGATLDHQIEDPNSTGFTAQSLSKPDDIHQVQDRIYGETFNSRGSATFLSNPIQNASVTKSSVGGYQGINMDFRGAGIGMDVAANPFGSLSQISLDEHDTTTQTAKLASLFHHSQTSDDDEARINESRNPDVVQSRHLKEMATSPLRRSASPLQVQITAEHVACPENTESMDFGVPHANSTPDVISTIELESNKPAKKKRGRKSKKLKHSDLTATVDTYEALQELDPLDIPQENYKPRPSRSRAGTVDSSKDYASHDSDVGKPKRQKRQKPTLSENNEGSFVGHRSSELNLSDPAMIGAPKEMYVPRASKSRSKRIFEEDEEDEEDELHSEGAVDENTDAEPAATPHPMQPSKPTQSKKKSGRKNKAKQAKVSATMVDESIMVDDDSDNNHALIDRLPSKFETDALSEVGVVEAEETVEVAVIDDEDGTGMARLPKGDSKTPSSLAKNISIDVPPVQTTNEIKPEVSEPAKTGPEPKKRGRKPKKKQVEVQIQAETELNPETPVSKPQLSTEQTLPPSDPDNNRPILSEKDQNVTTATTSTSPALSPSDIKPRNLEISADHEEGKHTGSTSPNVTEDHKDIQPSLKSSHTSVTSSSTTNSNPKSNSSLSWIKPRIGLSRRLQIPSLLRKLDRTRSPPRIAERKEKLSKRQLEEEEKRRLEAEDTGEQYVDKWDMRGKDGMLIEWDE